MTRKQRKIPIERFSVKSQHDENLLQTRRRRHFTEICKQVTTLKRSTFSLDKHLIFANIMGLAARPWPRIILF